MSAELSGIASRKIAGGAARRTLLRALTDQANNDGTGIYASVATLARDSELSDRTVQTHLKAFVAENLLRHVGRRECTHGYTNEYAINVAALKALPDIPREEDLPPVKSPRPRKSITGANASPEKEARINQPVAEEGETTTKSSGSDISPGEFAAPVKQAQAKENSPDPYKKTTSTSLRSVDVGVQTLDLLAHTKAREPRFEAFDELWGAWRERDLIRRSRKPKSLEAFKRAIKAGSSAERILAGARAYLANPDKTKERGQFMLSLTNFLDECEYDDWADEWASELRRRHAI